MKEVFRENKATSDPESSDPRHVCHTPGQLEGVRVEILRAKAKSCKLSEGVSPLGPSCQVGFFAALWVFPAKTADT